MSAKRIYAEVVSGIENTPDDDQSRMRAYQQESEEDALKKSHQIKEGIHDFHNGWIELHEKRGQKGQTIASRPSSLVVASTSNISKPTFLTENDIPGATLLGTNLRS